MDEPERDDNMEIEEDDDVTWGWEFPEIHDVDPTKCNIIALYFSDFFWIFTIIGRSDGKKATHTQLWQKKWNIRINAN